MQNFDKKEKTGILFAFMAALVSGLYPVLVNYGAYRIQPLVLASITTVLSSFLFFSFSALKGNLGELRNKEIYKPALMVTVFVVVIPYILFFVGASKTSGINTSVLLLSEIIFTFLLTPFIGEKTTVKKTIGFLGVFLGSLLILYNGTMSINIGDVFIILSTITLPIGNFYAKVLLESVSPSIILFIRSFLGGIFILLFSLFFGVWTDWVGAIKDNLFLVLFIAFVSLGVEKLIWYEGLERLDVSKSIILGKSSVLFSLVFLVVFFKETVSMFQWLGVMFMLVGVYFSVIRHSVSLKNKDF